MPNPQRAAYREDFASGADFLAAVVAGNLDHRLEPAAAATGLGENIPSEGGFAVPVQFASDLWQSVYDTGVILSLCTPQPVTRGDKLHIPAIDETSRADGSRFGGARMYWVDEGETPTATKPKYQRLTLQPKKLLGLSYATGELMADAPALAAWLERTFGLEASFAIEDAIINGSGAGRPLGLLNSGALITVTKESGQGAATVLPANLTKMAQRLWSASHRNAVWLMSNDAFAQIADAQFANGTPVVTYQGRQRFILGMPLLLVEYTAALGTAGDVILADFSQYLVSEIEPQFLSSIHLRFLYHESCFKFRYRVDGQSAWRSAITPKNSSTTQSPFVTLETRA